MSILQRYIAKTVILTTGLVVLVMAALIFIINLLDEMRDVGSGDYGFIQAFIHVVLGMPHQLYQYFPILTLLGSVISLGLLASHQELVVMRASGFSVRKIAGAMLIAALLFITLATGMGEWLGPKGLYMAQKRKQSEQNSGQVVATLSGIWIHEGNNFLHINRVIDPKHLEGVTRFEFNAKHQMLAAYYVTTLRMQDHHWQAMDAVKTIFNEHETHSQILEPGSWDLALNPALLTIGLVEPPEMTLVALRSYAAHLAKNGLQSAEFQWEFWKRVFQPLSTVVMILLAIPFVMRSSRSVTMGWRILFGLSVGFSFYILNNLFGQYSIVYQMSPIIAAMLPTLLFALIGYGVMRITKN